MKTITLVFAGLLLVVALTRLTAAPPSTRSAPPLLEVSRPSLPSPLPTTAPALAEAIVEPGCELLVRCADLLRIGHDGVFVRPVEADGSVSLPYGVVADVGDKTLDEARNAIAQGYFDAGIYAQGAFGSFAVSRYRTKAESQNSVAPLQPMQFLECKSAELGGPAMLTRVEADGKVFLPNYEERVSVVGRSVREVETYVNAQATTGSDGKPMLLLLRRITREEAEGILQDNERAAETLYKMRDDKP